MNHPNTHIPLIHPSVKTFLTERAPSPYRIDPEIHRSRLFKHLLTVIHTQLDYVNIPILGYTTGDWNIFEVPAIPLLDKQDIPEELWYACKHAGAYATAVSLKHTPLDAFLDTVVLSNSRALLEITSSMGSCLTGVQLIMMSSLIKSRLESTFTQDHVHGLREVAQSLYVISCCLDDALRIDEASTAAKGAISIYRRITTCTTNPKMKEEMALAMRLSSRCLSELGHHEEYLNLSKEALGIAKELTSIDPHGFEITHATLLRNHSYALQAQGEHKLGVELAEEAVAIVRKLSAAHPQTYDIDLASSLYSLAYHYNTCEKNEAALKVGDESVALYRRWERSSSPLQRANRLSSLAGALANQAIYLANTKHTSRSIRRSKEAIAIWRRILEDGIVRHARIEADLAYTLHSLAYHLRNCDRNLEAIEAIEESLSLRRRLVETSIGSLGTLEVHMADSLHNYAALLADLKRTDEAITAGLKAISIRRRYLAIYRNEGVIPIKPIVLETDLAWSLHNIADHYYTCDRYQDAVASVTEAVQIRRKLVDRDPANTEYNSSLAVSLHNYSRYQLSANASGYEKSIEAASECAEIRRKLAEENAEAFETLYAASLATIAYYYEEWQRYDCAILAVIKAANQYRRMIDRGLANNTRYSVFRYSLELAHALRRHAWYLCAIGQYDEAADPSHTCRDMYNALAQQAYSDDNLAADLNFLALFEGVRKRRVRERPTVDENLGSKQ
ncbi:hypothetical protein FA15DRAFT_670093 [Coprinopsis marcescibilis]|uniref:TPR-like protein n=1 Tax=Coprinopsis marcescibilis TaxID=230819 RepID=A0A5C3KTL5_COPMA|nr:hypothetical protein FA15DRAFT_670093 [Coprinopsis marcescibilis]